ncbi:MAG: hypothetical protein Q9227_002514 [Pyrenula ochraceoflavens]
MAIHQQYLRQLVRADDLCRRCHDSNRHLSSISIIPHPTTRPTPTPEKARHYWLLQLPHFVSHACQFSKDYRQNLTFCPPISEIGATVAHIYFTTRVSTPILIGAAFRGWPQTVTAQVVQSLNIVTVCIPYLRPFYESLQSGMLGADDLRRRKVSDTHGHGHGHGYGYGYGYGSNHSSSRKNATNNTSSSDRTRKGSEPLGNRAVVELSNMGRKKDRAETGSQSSQTNMITKTQSVFVDWSDARPMGGKYGNGFKRSDETHFDD